MNPFNGFTSGTMKKRLLDAGAFFKNYDLTKTYAENGFERSNDRYTSALRGALG